MKFSQAVRTSINGDEYYTQGKAVNMIVPFGGEIIAQMLESRRR